MVHKFIRIALRPYELLYKRDICVEKIYDHLRNIWKYRFFLPLGGLFCLNFTLLLPNNRRIFLYTRGRKFIKKKFILFSNSNVILIKKYNESLLTKKNSTYIFIIKLRERSVS